MIKIPKPASILYFLTFNTSHNFASQSAAKVYGKNEMCYIYIFPVSYTHLDVYKRQHTYTHSSDIK